MAFQRASPKTPTGKRAGPDSSLKTRVPNAWLTGEGLQGLDPTEQLILIRVWFAALAQARFDSNGFWGEPFQIPTVRIAEQSGLTTRSVRRILASLTKRRFLYRAETGAGGRRTIWQWGARAAESTKRRK